MSIETLKKLYKVFIFPYTLLLLYLMLLGFGREQFNYHIIRLTPIISTIEFIQNAKSIKHIITNILGNIILFIPFGFLKWVFPKIDNFKTLLFHFLSIIIIIETLQYFTRMGVFDIDDLLLNSFGLWIGYLLHKKVTHWATFH